MDVASLKNTPDMAGSNPYTKAQTIKLCIVRIIQDWTSYTRPNGKDSKFMKCYGADHTDFVEIIAYDNDTQERILKEGTSVMLKNFIMKDQVIKLTSTTKIYRCEPLTDVVSCPASAKISPVKEISTSPSKKLMNIVGTITKEESKKDVVSQNKQSKVKEITVSDSTGEIKCALWESMAEKETKCGKKYKILNATVKYSTFHMQNTLSLNSMSSIEEIEEEEEETKRVEIMGICTKEGNKITIIIDDTNQTEYTTSQEVFCKYLNVPDVHDTLTEETIATFLPLKCSITLKNNMTVTKISSE